MTRAIRLALAAILLPLTYLPNLLVAENWSTYRTQVALTSLLWFYTAMALIGWLKVDPVGGLFAGVRGFGGHYLRRARGPKCDA